MTTLHRLIASTILMTSSLLSLTSSTLPPLATVYRIPDGIPQNIARLSTAKVEYSNIIIVGGRNALYKFSPDLDLTSVFFTGPQPDNPECPPDPVECDLNRTVTDNDNKVLLQVPDYPVVFSCGSVWQGLCAAYTVARNITETKVYDKNLIVNYVASRAETVAFFAGGNRLLSASTYDDRPVEYHPFSVAARSLGKESLMLVAEGSSASSYVEVVERYKKAHKVHYIYGFPYDGFAYFVMLQNPGKALDSFETRIARVCLDDRSFLTYSEVPLKCGDGDTMYSLAETATLHASGATTRKKKSRPDGDEEMTLSVAFGKPYSGTGFVNDPKLGSALCQFRMSDVVSMFENATIDCNNGSPKASLLRLLHGETHLRCQQFAPIGGQDFCEYGHNYYIESVLHLPGRLVVERKDDLMTSLLMLRQGEGSSRGNVAWVGDSKGRLSKYRISGKIAKLLYSVNVSRQEEPMIQSRIRKSVAVDADESFGYFLAGRSVVKFPVGSCSIYGSCSSCMKAYADPLGCGWCVDRCAHQGECSTAVEAQRCPVVIDKVYPTRGPSFGGTLLTIEGDNFGSSIDPKESSIEVIVGDKVCSIQLWTFTKVQCNVNGSSNATSAEIRVTVNDTSYHAEEKPYDVMDTQIAQEPFQYVDVSISRIYPTSGPVSGGTDLTIRGNNLDAGVKREVRLGDYHTCEIYSITNEAVMCKTANIAADVIRSHHMKISYLMDGTEVPMSCENCTERYLFWYRPDPSVESVSPKAATFAGGTNITVRGRHLDSANQPMLVLQSDGGDGGNGISTRCYAWDSRNMSCTVPSLYNSTIVKPERLQKHKVPILVHGHFQMDGLRLGSKPGKQSFDFIYRPDPMFGTFAGEGNEIEVSLSDLTLEIPGEHLDSIISKEEVDVKVGDVNFACEVTDIQPTALFCSLRPEDFKEVSEHTVEVVLAGNTYSVGAVRLVPAKVARHTGLIVSVVVIIFIVVIIVFGVLYYIRHRNKKKVPEYFVDYRAEDGTRGNNYVRPNDEAREALMGQTFELDSETRAMLESEKILYQREYLVLGPVIGQGHFGCVYRGTLELQGKGEVLSVAVKTLHNNSRGVEIDGQAFLEEALIMKDFHHTNVLSLIGLCVDTDGQLMVITPYMKYGDLLSYIRDERNSPTVKDLITYGIHIAEGMNYLSSQKFVHRDLAARNCMLSEDFTVHVADFGLSRDVYEKDYYSGDNKKTKLPVKWMAPESLEKGIYNHKTDVWAYGVVLWELMTRGVTPYPEVDNWDIVNFLKQGRRMQQPSFCPDLLYEIMLQCWEEDPKKRPAFSRLVHEVTNVITTLQKKKRDRPVGLKVTYVNYPRPEGHDEDDDDEAGPSYGR